MTDDTTNALLARLDALARAVRQPATGDAKRAAMVGLRQLYRDFVRAGWPLAVAREVMDHALQGGTLDSWLCGVALREPGAEPTLGVPPVGDSSEVHAPVESADHEASGHASAAQSRVPGTPRGTGGEDDASAEATADVPDRWARHRALATARPATAARSAWSWVPNDDAHGQVEDTSAPVDADRTDRGRNAAGKARATPAQAGGSDPDLWPYAFGPDEFEDDEIVEHVFRERNEWSIELVERLAHTHGVTLWREARERWSTLHVEGPWRALRALLADHARKADELEDFIAEWLDDQT